MDTKKLYDILSSTTVQLRKGEAVEREQTDGVDVVHIYLMPDESAAPADMLKVDVHFITIGVDLVEAGKRKDEFLAILDDYPKPDRLAGGPSYIELGAEIGDQGAALQFFALGKALELWDIITPATMGFSGAQANQMAGSGFVMISGYKGLVATPTNTL